MFPFFYTGIKRKVFAVMCLLTLMTLVPMAYTSMVALREAQSLGAGANKSWARIMSSRSLKQAVSEQAQMYTANFMKFSSACSLLALQASMVVDALGQDDSSVTSQQVFKESSNLSPLDPIMRKICQLNPEVTAVYLVTRSGISHSLTAGGAGDAKGIMAMALRDFVGDLSNAPRFQLVRDSGTGSVVLVSVPIVNASGLVQGVAGLEFLLYTVNERFLCGPKSSLCPWEKGLVAFFLDGQGRLIAFPGELRKLFGFETLSSSLILSESGNAGVRELESCIADFGLCHETSLVIGGEPYLATSTYLDPMGWHLVMAAPQNNLPIGYKGLEENLVQTISHVSQKHLALNAVFLLAGAILIVLVVHRILDPVRHLTESAKEVAEGNFDVRSDVSGADELSLLATAFNAMILKLQQALAMEKVSRRTMEEKVLERTFELEQANNDLTEARDALEEKVAKRTGELQSLNEYLNITELRERRRLAEYLHDGVAQTLGLCVSKVKTITEKDQEVTGIEALTEVQNHMERCVREIRSLTYQLSPPILYDFDLDIAIGWLTEEMGEQYELNISYINELKQDLKLNDRIKEVLYRSVHELIMNIVKHAGVPDVVIRINSQGGTVTIEVQDFGKGFDTSVSGELSYQSFGLFSISERLKSIGGTADFCSEPGSGTRVILAAPDNG